MPPFSVTPTPAALMIDHARAAFTDSAIDALVHGFYGRVREDELLRPVFADRITDWDRHLARMTLFWRAVLRGEVGYRPERGSPRALHRRLEEATLEHYDRWLELFDETARGVFDASTAGHVVERARRMARHLSDHLPAQTATG